MKHFEVF